ncbi:PREDICTED: probable glutathione S-transferase isoform X2 [Ipomoea nil]|uniref:probable glutathione S-transferase isoform X2 n=1 Tax=Ipomoea nil TaxID=35883 RepID=UPI000901ADCD|nr:PREDICTED: probable glutathione S-transferase isoform X2 [Ipomoea nil]
MSEVEVLGGPLSPFSFRVEIALKLKGIQYDFIQEEDYRFNKSPLLLKYNPVHKKIPVLLHNGKSLAESLIILEYIDETWDNNTAPLLPKDPYQRAQARFWAKFIDEKCVAATRKILYAEESEKARDEVQGALNLLVDELNGKTLFGGESVGLVDIAAIVVGYWIDVIQEAAGLEVLSREKHAKIYEWMEALMSKCSVIKENLPPRDKLLAYYQARIIGKGIIAH